MKPITTIPKRIVNRVLANVIVDDNDCHVSTYSVGSHGYAQVGWSTDGERFMTLCHRVVWIACNGPIPERYTVDHQQEVCGNRKCVNINHLRLLTNFENARRTAGRDWPLGECINGHDNSSLRVEPSGRIRCYECKLDTQARYRARKRLIEEGTRRYGDKAMSKR